MDRIYSPWRADHVARVAETGEYNSPVSIFSRISASNDDDQNYVLWRGDYVFILLNLYPYTNGHLMVVPFRQVVNYEDLTPEELVEMSIAVRYCISWLKSTINPDGFNVGLNIGLAAGAGITNHLHTHIVPRWSGDTNFTTTIGAFRVVPESLETTYERLMAEVSRNPVVVPKLSV